MFLGCGVIDKCGLKVGAEIIIAVLCWHLISFLSHPIAYAVAACETVTHGARALDLPFRESEMVPTFMQYVRSVCLHTQQPEQENCVHAQ